MIGPLFAAARRTANRPDLRPLPGGRQTGTMGDRRRAQAVLQSGGGGATEPACAALVIATRWARGARHEPITPSFCCGWGVGCANHQFFALPGGASGDSLADRHGGAVDRIARRTPSGHDGGVGAALRAHLRRGAGQRRPRAPARDVDTSTSRCWWARACSGWGVQAAAHRQCVGARAAARRGAGDAGRRAAVGAAALGRQWRSAADRLCPRLSLLACLLPRRATLHERRGAHRAMSIVLAFALATLLGLVAEELPLSTLALATAPGGCRRCASPPGAAAGRTLVTVCHVLRVVVLTVGAQWSFGIFRRLVAPSERRRYARGAYRRGIRRRPPGQVIGVSLRPGCRGRRIGRVEARPCGGCVQAGQGLARGGAEGDRVELAGGDRGVRFVRRVAHADQHATVGGAPSVTTSPCCWPKKSPRIRCRWASRQSFRAAGEPVCQTRSGRCRSCRCCSC